MTIDDALATVLERLSDAQLVAVAAHCAPRTTPGQILDAVAGGSVAAHDALRDLASAWTATSGLTGSGIALALRTGLRARRHAARRRCVPVWTGPGAVGEQRLTGSVLHELIAGATERVLLVSYAAYTLPQIAKDLEAAVARGCSVDVVFETTTDSGGQYDGPSAPFNQVTGIRRWRWPADKRDAGGAALHAKLLVVDARRALIGSANLTHRALNANLEAGVLLGDADVASALDAHIRRLIRAGILTPAS